jgi:hypothetical protein
VPDGKYDAEARSEADDGEKEGVDVGCGVEGSGRTLLLHHSIYYHE